MKLFKSILVLFTSILLLEMSAYSALPISPITSTEANSSIRIKWNEAFREIHTNRLLINNNISTNVYMKKSVYAPDNGRLWIYTNTAGRAGFNTTSYDGIPMWTSISSNGTTQTYNLLLDDVTGGGSILSNFNYIQASINSQAVINAELAIALTNILSQAIYMHPEVTFVEPGDVRLLIGDSIVGDINLSFIVNKVVSDREYSGDYSENIGPGQSYDFTHSDNTVSTEAKTNTFTITVIDTFDNVDSASKSYIFNNYIYYTKLTNEFATVTNPLLIVGDYDWEQRGHAAFINTVTNAYIYVAYPSRLGPCTNFSIGGLPTPPWPVEQRDVTNSLLYVEDYYIYHTEYKQNEIINYDIH